MPAKINITNDVQRFYDAHHQVRMDLGLCASMALLNVVPDGVTVPEATLCNSEFGHDEALTVHFEYNLENIPAHGTWKFAFMFRSSSCAAVMISKCNASGFNTRTCKFDTVEIGEKVKELAEL